jgi:hypothetical protein
MSLKTLYFRTLFAFAAILQVETRMKTRVKEKLLETVNSEKQAFQIRHRRRLQALLQFLIREL